MTAPQASSTSGGELALEFTRLDLNALDLGSALQPVLDSLAANTAAVGSGYVQWRDQTQAYHARASGGEMPQGTMMAALLAHGLPRQLPLIDALQDKPGVMFFPDIRLEPITTGFPDLGVKSLIAAPIRGRDGHLVGTVLAHSFTQHHWNPD